MSAASLNGYHPQVAELFERTPFAGEMPPAPDVFAGAAGSLAQGAEVRFWIRVGQRRIQAISFRAYGCPHTIAAASWIAQHARGVPLADVERTAWLEVEQALAVPAPKRGRLLIVEDALKAAVNAASQNV